MRRVSPEWSERACLRDSSHLEAAHQSCRKLGEYERDFFSLRHVRLASFQEHLALTDQIGHASPVNLWDRARR